MKLIKVPFIQNSNSFNAVSESVIVDTINWKEFNYKPDVRFKIAYTDTHICINFKVKESNVRGLEMNENGRVHKDSCVEFFFSPNGDMDYYNFEFNCIGTRHVGYGNANDRANRIHIPIERLKQIEVSTSLPHEPIDEKNASFEWDLSAFIPLSFFEEQEIDSLKGKKSSCNIYKCGDDTDVPHFLSWNAIETENPDFHRPEFFGAIEF